MPIQRERARDASECIVHVFTAPELQGERAGILAREDGETDERYASRVETLLTLLGAGWHPPA